MRADYIENQNPYEYESVRKLPAKQGRVGIRHVDITRKTTKHYKPYNEQYVVHGIVQVCENVYEIEHELINLRGICDPERDLKCCSEVRRC